MRWILLGVSVALTGCYTGAATGNGNEAGTTGHDGLTSSTDLGATAGLPCDVAQLLETYCSACHGTSGAQSVRLVSHDDLLRTSSFDPTKNEAQVSLMRMQGKTMPPAGSAAPTAQEIAAFATWVQAGTPTGDCNTTPTGDAGPDPFAGPHVCTSGSYYSFGHNTAMEPGNACISCHTQQGEGPRYRIAGTVYPTGHEPSRCKSTGVQGAQVVVTDATGAVHTYNANSVGNFYGTAPIVMPYRAEVRYGGKVRVMVASQTSGDCNSCHTENGANGAPGRILLP